MKFLIALLTLIYSTFSFGQKDKRFLLLFDGVYETKCYFEKGDEEGSQDYVRFYANGKVITVGTDCEGSVNELKDWFTINAEQVAAGEYKIKGKRLFFTTKTKTGLIKYIGRIDNNQVIKLKWKSLINGNKGKARYNFIPI